MSCGRAEEGEAKKKRGTLRQTGCGLLASSGFLLSSSLLIFSPLFRFSSHSSSSPSFSTMPAKASLSICSYTEGLGIFTSTSFFSPNMYHVMFWLTPKPTNEEKEKRGRGMQAPRQPSSTCGEKKEGVKSGREKNSSRRREREEGNTGLKNEGANYGQRLSIGRQPNYRRIFGE